MAAGLAALVLLAAAFTAPGPTAGPGAGGTPEARAAASTALRSFAATDLSGRHWTAAGLGGRVVLLDFWATWCAPCLAELPRLRALREKHSRGDLEILGISLDVKSRRAFVSWLNRNRIDWPQIHDRAGYGGRVPRLFGVDALPRTVVLTREGAVAAVDLRGERLARLIDALVAAGPAGVSAGARLP